MPTLKTVTVTYDSTLSSLSIDPPSLSLGDGDWVLWTFENVPPGATAHIFFPETRFGPFESLRLLSAGMLLGEGKVDIPTLSVYDYTALVLNPSESLATGGGSLTNSPQGPNTSPDVLVECVEIDGQFSLVVEPLDHLMLYTGDTATWHVLGIPEGHFVTIVFYETSDPRTGPFATFSQGRALAGAGTDQFLAIGARFSWHEPELPYTIELRDGDGNLVDVKDPRIDNIGDPPTGFD